MSSEQLNKMKLCPLCKEDEKYPYQPVDGVLHERDGMHRTLGKSWFPNKGHKDYETHIKWCELLKLGKNATD